MRVQTDPPPTEQKCGQGVRQVAHSSASERSTDYIPKRETFALPNTSRYVDCVFDERQTICENWWLFGLWEQIVTMFSWYSQSVCKRDCILGLKAAAQKTSQHLNQKQTLSLTTSRQLFLTLVILSSMNESVNTSYRSPEPGTNDFDNLVLLTSIVSFHYLLIRIDLIQKK